MRRRSSAGGEPAKVQRRKAVARKSRVTSKAADPKSSSAAREETKTRLARERDEALQQQRATADENARLHDELRELLRQKTATADVLKIISRSTFDLTKVLKTLLVSAARLCGADEGNIVRPSETDAHYYVAANYRHTPEYDELQRHLTYTPGRGSVIGRVLLEGKSVQIPDVLSDPEYAYPELVRAGNFRTVLGVPLLREGIPIGVLVLQRAAVRPFIEKQIKLVETFADQAVIAIENTRLFEAEQQRSRELSESLEQQTATSEVLQVISSSPGDLQPVFATMLENAARICDAKFGNIYRWNGCVASRSTHNTPPAFANIAGVHPNVTGPAAGRMVSTKTAIHVADLQRSRLHRTARTENRRGRRTGGVRTSGCPDVEGKRNDRCVHRLPPGSSSLYRQADRASPKLRHTGRHRHREHAPAQRTTRIAGAADSRSEVLQVISSSPGDLQPVFETMLQNAVRICDAKFGNIFRWDGDALHLVATHNIPAAFAELRRRSPFRPGPENHIGRMVATKAVVHVADLAADQRYIERRDPAAVAAVELGGIRTFVAVPMLKENELIGALIVYRQEVRP